MKAILFCAALALPAARATPADNDALPAREDVPAAAPSESVTDPPDAGTARIRNMLMHALSLIGAGYRYGGNSLDRGFDCSGFVRHVFAESMALELPRSSLEMSKLGIAVQDSDLLPGDLLFFNTLKRRFSHVGIYLGNGRFVHAPSRGKRVEIVDMSDRYWKNRFNGARRLVEPG